jgi:hypothetical protein
MSEYGAEHIRVSTINQNTDREVETTALDITSDCSHVR